MTGASGEEDLDFPYSGVLLVGFMASGKSSVGRRLADRLGWRFVDVDDVIESEAERPIWKLFEEEGEPYFRRLEARIVNEWLPKTRIVLAPGGGWPAYEGRMESCPSTFLSVWLKVSSETSLKRSQADGTRRPLLESGDRRAASETLLLRRCAYYSKAQLHLDSEKRTLDEMTETIARRITSVTTGPLTRVIDN